MLQGMREAAPLVRPEVAASTARPQPDSTYAKTRALPLAELVAVIESQLDRGSQISSILIFAAKFMA